jgi:BTB/POZ domain-containing protein KCTD9
MKRNVKRTIIRILSAISGTILLVVIVLAIESFFEKDCRPREAWLICQIRESVILNIVESLSIFMAVLLFVLEAPERNKQAHYDAWKVIDSAYGLKSSYARIQALEDLNEDGVSLNRLNAPEADLKGIDLEKADLSNAYLSGCDLSRAKLERANFSNAELVESNFTNSDLSSTRLTGANLGYAYFIDANLSNADLVGASLVGANLVGANLSQAYLGDADLSYAKLDNANIRHARLFGVKNLTPEQVKAAKHWEDAMYDASFCKQLGI